jgi:hypothetical protein
VATEDLYISAFDVNSGVTWNNTSNAIGGETESEADSSDIADAQYGGFNMDNTSYAPDEGSTDITYVAVRHRDINAEHADDVYQLQFYDADTSTWVDGPPPYNSGNLMPSSLTTTTITTAVQSRYGSAVDKRAFIDGLQFRLTCAKTKGNDNVNWGISAGLEYKCR